MPSASRASAATARRTAAATATPADVRTRALRLLARREYARAELRERLARAGGERDEVERVLDALERDGYLSDARFAQMLVAHKAGRFGRRAIVHALRERGVADEAAREALRTLHDVDELASARALVLRRFAGPAGDAREAARRVRFLIARGYSPATARAAVLGRAE